MAARKSEQPLYVVYLARVINIPAVQCHREAVTDDRTAQFFSEGCRPDTLEFQWFLDEPDLSFWEPASAISPTSLQAWNVAFVAFLGFIHKLASGELIANGVYQATGVRHDLNRTEWTRERLILDATVLCGGRPSRCERAFKNKSLEELIGTIGGGTRRLVGNRVCSRRTRKPTYAKPRR